MYSVQARKLMQSDGDPTEPLISQRASQLRTTLQTDREPKSQMCPRFGTVIAHTLSASTGL
jgi:hypothetical protein